LVPWTAVHYVSFIYSRKVGFKQFFYVSILLADFAAWSASSFPFIPEWPGIHIILILGAFKYY